MPLKYNRKQMTLSFPCQITVEIRYGTGTNIEVRNPLLAFILWFHLVFINYNEERDMIQLKYYRKLMILYNDMSTSSLIIYED